VQIAPRHKHLTIPWWRLVAGHWRATGPGCILPPMPTEPRAGESGYYSTPWARSGARPQARFTTENA